MCFEKERDALIRPFINSSIPSSIRIFVQTLKKGIYFFYFLYI